MKDPTTLGQIQVTYPWLNGPEHRWVASPRRWRAGTAALSACREVDDEVIIGFHRGMWDHPIVIGFTWNPEQTPPSRGRAPLHVRSENGHTIYFVDSTPCRRQQRRLIIKDGHGTRS